MNTKIIKDQDELLGRLEIFLKSFVLCSAGRIDAINGTNEVGNLWNDAIESQPTEVMTEFFDFLGDFKTDNKELTDRLLGMNFAIALLKKRSETNFLDQVNNCIKANMNYITKREK
jgi:hypothetical protein